MDQGMNDQWLAFAIRIQSIAQAGLQYGKDEYDRERYEALRQIAAEMVSMKTDIPTGRIRNLFCNETGYQTPKIDTRAAVFLGEKSCMSMQHRNHGDGPFWRRRAAGEPGRGEMHPGANQDVF